MGNSASSKRLSLADITMPTLSDPRRMEDLYGPLWWLESGVDAEAQLLSRERSEQAAANGLRAAEREVENGQAWAGRMMPRSTPHHASRSETGVYQAVRDIISMSRDVLNGISLQARLTGEAPDRQSVIALFQSVVCIVKQCIEERRYALPLGVGNRAAELRDARILRLAARYARCADAAYKVTSASPEAAVRVVNFVDGDAEPAPSLTVLELYPTQRLSAGSKRIMAVYTPPVYLATDHKNGDAMVCAIRGTHSAADALIDGLATPVHVEGASLFEGYAHSGITNATHAVLDLVSARINEFVAAQVEALEAGQVGKQLVITGHSLGGAVAVLSLVVLLCRHKTIRRAIKYGLIKVFTFGAPPSMAFKDIRYWTGKELYVAALLEHGQPIWNFVNEFDPVPRFGVRSAQLLFTAANRVRSSGLQKFLYLRCGVKLEERLADHAEPIALGRHAHKSEPRDSLRKIRDFLGATAAARPRLTRRMRAEEKGRADADDAAREHLDLSFVMFFGDE